MDAEQLHVLPPDEKFEKTTGITDDATTDSILVRCPPDYVLDALLLERFFRCAHHTGFRDRVDTGGQPPRDFSAYFQLQGVTHGASSLVHARGGKRRKPDHVSGCVNMRRGSPVVLVYVNQAVIADCYAGGGQVQILDIALPSSGNQYRINLQRRARSQLERDAIRPRTGTLQHAFVPVEDNAVALHRAAQRLRNFGVKKWQQYIATVDEMNLHAERRERAGILAADHTGTNRRQRLGQTIQIQSGVGVIHARFAERKHCWPLWRRASRNEYFLARERRSANPDIVRVFKDTGAGMKVDFLGRDLLCDHGVEAGSDILLVR